MQGQQASGVGSNADVWLAKRGQAGNMCENEAGVCGYMEDGVGGDFIIWAPRLAPNSLRRLFPAYCDNILHYSRFARAIGQCRCRSPVCARCFCTAAIDRPTCINGRRV
jgi:hypothetical protein